MNEFGEENKKERSHFHLIGRRLPSGPLTDSARSARALPLPRRAMPHVWPNVASPAQGHARAAPAHRRAAPAFPACPATTRRPYTGGEGRCSDQRSAQEPTRRALHPTLLSLAALSPCLSLSSRARARARLRHRPHQRLAGVSRFGRSSSPELAPSLPLLRFAISQLVLALVRLGKLSPAVNPSSE